LHRQAFVRPVLLEIALKIQDSDASETQLPQCAEGRTNVRAVAPGAAAAIENDLVTVWNVPDFMLKNFQGSRL
jgi:hypothetical protein